MLDRAEEATQLLFDCMKFVDHTDAKVITYELLASSLCKWIEIWLRKSYSDPNKCLCLVLKVIFFAIVHAEKIGHYGRVIKLSQTFLESANGSGGSNGKVNDISFKKHLIFLCLLF